MRRKAPSTTNVPPVIELNAVFTRDSLRAALGLREYTLKREIREGRLRFSKRAGRHFILGRWVLEWLETGEVRRRKRPAAALTNGTGGEGPVRAG
jgi:hypothetical protein